MKIKKILHRRKGKLSEQQIFTSPEMKKFLLSCIKTVNQQFHISTADLHVLYNTADKLTACTSIQTMLVNAGCPLFDAETADGRLVNVEGVLLHETGHRLFTNYTAAKAFTEAISCGNFWPAAPAVDSSLAGNLSILTDLINSDQAPIVSAVAGRLANSVEDGRIEGLLFSNVQNASSMFEGLNNLREKMWDEARDLAELEALVDSKDVLFFEALMQMILDYSRFGMTKGYDPLDAEVSSHPLMQKFEEITAYIDEYLGSLEAVRCFASLNKILVVCAPEILEYKKEVEEKQQQAKRNQGSHDESTESANASSSDNAGSNGGASTSSANADSNDAENSEAEHSSDNDAENSEAEHSSDNDGGNSEAEHSSDNDAESSCNGNSSSADSESSGTTSISVEELVAAMNERLDENVTGQSSDNSENMSGEGTDEAGMKRLTQGNEFAPGGNAGGKSGSEGGDLVRLKTKTFSSLGSGVRTSEAKCGTDSNTKLDLSKMQKAITERLDEESNVAEVENDYSALIADNDFGALHKNVNVNVVRFTPAESNFDDYKSVQKEVETIAKAMARKSDFFSKDLEPIELKGLYYGTKFKASSMANANLKHFSKRKNQESPYSVEVAVVIDESESMSGHRSESAKMMALIVHQYCSELGIGCSIYGHSTHGWSNVDLYVYADSKNPTSKDTYRLMNIGARGCNRDGYAIRTALSRLEDNQEAQKLLFVICDGQPNDGDYCGTAAEADLHDIARHCERNNIGLVVAAIGSDKDKIKRIYGESHFLDIENLDTLPIRMVKQIRAVLR